MTRIVLFLATAVMLWPITVAPPARAQRTIDARVEVRNKTALRDGFARWAAGGTTFFDDILAPDMTWTIIGTGFGAGTYRGLDTFKRIVITPFAARLATPIRPLVKNIWADGDHVIVRWHGTAQTRAGNPYRNDYVWIFRMRDGRAEEVTAFLDLPAYQAVFRER